LTYIDRLFWHSIADTFHILSETYHYLSLPPYLEIVYEKFVVKSIGNPMSEVNTSLAHPAGERQVAASTPKPGPECGQNPARSVFILWLICLPAV